MINLIDFINNIKRFENNKRTTRKKKKKNKNKKTNAIKISIIFRLKLTNTNSNFQKNSKLIDSTKIKTKMRKK